MRPTDSSLPALAALAGLALGACSVAPDGGEYGEQVRFTSYQLAEELVIGAEDGWARAAALRLAPRLEAQLRRPVHVVGLDAARPAERRLRMLIAGPQAPGLREVLDALAQQRADLGQFGSTPNPRGAALIATLPDPLRPDFPLSVCLAVPGSELVDPGLDLDLAATFAPTWRAGWQVFDGGALQATSDDPTPSAPAPRAPARTPAEWSAAEPELAWLAAEAEAVRSSVEALLGPPREPLPPLRVRLWERPVDLARDAGGFARWIARPAAGVLELARDCPPREARRALAELIARAGWGEPSQAWLAEGLGVHVAGAWWGRDLETWCARLARDELVLDLDQIVAGGELSPHQVGPLRGLLVGEIVAGHGAEAVGLLWREGLAGQLHRMRAPLASRLERLREVHATGLAREALAVRTAVRQRPFRHGLNLVAAGPERGRPGAGFGSRAAADRLAQLAELGADAVAFDWAVVLEVPAARLAYGRRTPSGSQADDLALEAGARAAAAQGLDLLLKPHLWLSDTGTYAGWALTHSAQEWQRYFDAERRLVVHYGLLGELIGAEILCLGAEQRNASVTLADHGDAFWPPEHFAWKRARWAEVIACARAAFDGGLTYASHWDGERDGIAFWGDLDFVGLDLFAPFPSADPGPAPPFDPSVVRDNLVYALEQARLAASWKGKRLLICELGFPSTGGAWSNPEVPAGPPDPARQVAMLDALGDALETWSGEPDAVAGLFLWNSSCDPAAGAPDQRGYSLDGELARPVLQRVLALP